VERRRRGAHPQGDDLALLDTPLVAVGLYDAGASGRGDPPPRRAGPGVLGDDLSIEESRIASSDVYTRPETIVYKKKKYKVPEILLTGHHAKIEEWKKKVNEMKKN